MKWPIPKFAGLNQKKIWFILGFFLAGWVATLVIWYCRDYIFGLGDNVYKEVFLAWTGELIFFTVVGLAVTVITMEKPPNPTSLKFDERFQILFGDKDNPREVQRFHKQEIELLARYSSAGSRKIIIREFKPELNAYVVMVHNWYVLNNAFRDVHLMEKIPLQITPDPFEGKNLPNVGQINHIKINKSEKIHNFTPIPVIGYKIEFEEPLPAAGEIHIEIEYEVLMGCGFLQEQEARRFMQSMQIEITNQLPHNVLLAVTDEPGPPIPLEPTRPAEFFRTNVEPKGMIFGFKLLEPGAGGNLGEQNTVLAAARDGAGDAAPAVLPSSL